MTLRRSGWKLFTGLIIFRALSRLGSRLGLTEKRRAQLGLEKWKFALLKKQSKLIVEFKVVKCE